MTHDERTRRLADAIARRGPPPGEDSPCPYLPGRIARQLTLIPTPLVPGVYRSLMDLNFRRLGPVFYRPQCEGCDECRMIRVLAGEFRPSRAQRRCRARNADVTVAVGSPTPTAEKHRLYRRYLAARHDGRMDGSLAEFHGFLYTSEVETIEMVYRVGERIVGVGLADVEPSALSAVYFYFDPQEAPRSLGVFNVLWTIEECRRRSVPYFYLGYYVRECQKMSYKADYRPCEVLAAGGTWLRT